MAQTSCSIPIEVGGVDKWWGLEEAAEVDSYNDDHVFGRGYLLYCNPYTVPSHHGGIGLMGWAPLGQDFIIHQMDSGKNVSGGGITALEKL